MVILGLDASTTCVGYAFTKDKKILDMGFIDIKKEKTPKENVRSYRYRGLIRDPNRKKSKRRDYSGVRRKAIKEMLGFGADCP